MPPGGFRRGGSCVWSGVFVSLVVLVMYVGRYVCSLVLVGYGRDIVYRERRGFFLGMKWLK